MRLVALAVVWVAFTGWSMWSVQETGLPGLATLLQTDPWGRQVFVDLAISLVVGLSFIRGDAKARGLPYWPYVAASLVMGSIGLLPYVMHREWRSRRDVS